MNVIDDIQSRIAAIRQLMPGLTSGNVVSADASMSAVPTYASEFESALASVSSNDLASGAASGYATSGVSTQSGATISGGVTGDAVVADARRYLGVPYVYGGNDPKTGLDCSALVQHAYGDLGISLPRTSQEQATMGMAVPSLAQALPGDLVCFGNPATHIGIYVGDGKMIDAPHTGTNVQIQDITAAPSTIRRIVSGSSQSLLPPIAAHRPAALANSAEGSWPSGEAAYSAAFTAAEKKYGLPAGLLSAIAHAESNYQPDAVSSAGAIGLMQLMPATAQALGVDPNNPPEAIDGAARLLKGQLNKYGSVPLAAAAYNAGGPAVDNYGGIPPYAETQAYVRKVMAYMNEDA